MRISDWSSDVCSSDLNVGLDCYEGLIVNSQHVRDQATDAPETYDHGCCADTFANGYTRLLTRPHIDFACDNMPQFGEEWGDSKSYGGDNLPKGGGGGQNAVSCSGGRQADQCRFGRRRHQHPSLQRRTAPGAADRKSVGEGTSVSVRVDTGGRRL